jgi:Uri superfamily endonuclease
MAIATHEQQAKRSAICAACPLNNNGWCDDTKGGCGCFIAAKVMPRSSHCPLGKWSAYRDRYKPLVNPTRSLMFHLYPLKGKELNWHWHIEQIRKHQHKFNGKIIIGVGVDKRTATMEQVQSLFDGIRVDHWLKADNTKLAETLTHVEMLSLLQTDDPNAIIFRYHTKGVTKSRDAVEQTWAQIMWDGNMDLPSVEDALASHLVCGVMRSQTPLVSKKPGDYFFAGSAYWMRAKEVFERDWRWKEPNRWVVEYVPCHLFSFAESACIFHDLVPSSVLDHGYFEKHVTPEWTAWKASRGIE